MNVKRQKQYKKCGGQTLNDLLNLMSSAIRLSISCLTNNCLFFMSLSFSLDTNSRKAVSAVGYKKQKE